MVVKRCRLGVASMFLGTKQVVISVGCFCSGRMGWRTCLPYVSTNLPPSRVSWSTVCRSFFASYWYFCAFSPSRFNLRRRPRAYYDVLCCARTYIYMQIGLVLSTPLIPLPALPHLGVIVLWFWDDDASHTAGGLVLPSTTFWTRSWSQA